MKDANLWKLEENSEGKGNSKSISKIVSDIIQEKKKLFKSFSPDFIPVELLTYEVGEIGTSNFKVVCPLLMVPKADINKINIFNIEELNKLKNKYSVFKFEINFNNVPGDEETQEVEFKNG